jgi:glycosyltransferase involved in cell wall biosynthesis
MKNKISCFINSFNSEKYLREYLKSVSGCDKIIVVDM